MARRQPPCDTGRKYDSNSEQLAVDMGYIDISSNSSGDLELFDLGQNLVENYIDLSPEERCMAASKCKDKHISRRQHQTTVMVAGKPRNGKSSALNNIFGVQLEARPSVKPVTRDVNITEAKRDNCMFKIIDTPGLGSLDISTEKTLESMKQATAGTEYTLIYCFSVCPDSLLDETDKALMESLHISLGKDVWKNCIVLLTFSDFALDEFSSAEMYVKHIRSHAKEFQHLLNSICEDPPNVKTIFECGPLKRQEKSVRSCEIVAVPVMKRTKNSDCILPGLLQEGQDWTNIIIDHLVRLSEYK